jgi:hypothetical protein
MATCCASHAHDAQRSLQASLYSVAQLHNTVPPRHCGQRSFCRALPLRQARIRQSFCTMTPRGRDCRSIGRSRRPRSTAKPRVDGKDLEVAARLLTGNSAVGRARQFRGSALVRPHPSELPQLVLVPSARRCLMEHGVELGRVHLRHFALHPLPAEPLRHVEYGHAPRYRVPVVLTRPVPASHRSRTWRSSALALPLA